MSNATKFLSHWSSGEVSSERTARIRAEIVERCGSLKEFLMKRWKIVAIVAAAVLLFILILGLGLGLGLRKKSPPAAPSAYTTSSSGVTTTTPTHIFTVKINSTSTTPTTTTHSGPTTTLPPVTCTISKQQLLLTMLFDITQFAAISSGIWMKPVAELFVNELELNETAKRKVRIGLVGENFTWKLQNYSNNESVVMDAVRDSFINTTDGQKFNLGSALEAIANETTQVTSSNYSSFIMIFGFASIRGEAVAVKASERLRSKGEHLLAVTRDDATKLKYKDIVKNLDDVLDFEDDNANFAQTWLQSRVCLAIPKRVFKT